MEQTAKIEIFENDKFKIGLLYLVMLSGGILQYFKIMQVAMGYLATIVIFGTTIFLCFEFFGYLKKIAKNDGELKKQVKKVSIWLILVFIISLLVENIGVVTGLIFGSYIYGPVLYPFIGFVPVAIGFAWLNTLLPATMIAVLFIKSTSSGRAWIISFAVGILMVVFDIVLEHAAIELNYWRWQNEAVPLQNYFAWFILGIIFARIGFALKADSYGFPNIFKHVYLAQLGYFFIVILR